MQKFVRIRNILKKYKRTIILVSVFTSIFLLGNKIFKNSQDYIATLDNFTELGFVGNEYFNQRSSDSLDATLLNSDNIYLSNKNYLIHLQLLSNTENNSPIKFFLPNLKESYKITYTKNYNSLEPLRTEFKTVKDGYVDFDNVQLNFGDYLDIWVVFSCANYDSLISLLNIKNYHFLVNYDKKINLQQTITYFEKIDSFYYSGLTFIIGKPPIQILLFLLTLYGFYIVIYRAKNFKYSSLKKIDKTSIWKYISLLIGYVPLCLGIYDTFFAKQLGAENIDIFSSSSKFIPSIPTYDMSGDSPAIYVPIDPNTSKPDYKIAIKVPTILKIDTIYTDYSYIQTYIFKTKEGKRIPEVTILSPNSSANKYFSNFKKGVINTKVVTDTIAVIKGFAGTSSFRLFSKQPIENNELEFHSSDNVYYVTHTEKSITTFNFLDYFLTNLIISSFLFQMVILFFSYSAIINIIRVIFKYFFTKK